MSNRTMFPTKPLRSFYRYVKQIPNIDSSGEILKNEVRTASYRREMAKEMGG
jgi:hypothetical protein